jgi:hypothetical protein
MGWLGLRFGVIFRLERANYRVVMSTAELIYEKTKGLPEALQTEALHYVDYLLSQKDATAEAVAWARFSAAQLAKQYAPADAIYDEDPSGT